MELVEIFWKELSKLLTYAQYCAGRDMQTIVCRDFWIGMAYAIAGFGLLVVALVTRKLVREQQFRRRLEV